MTKKPAFWILLGLASVLAAAFAIRFFSSAFPIISLDLRMDRAAALRSARGLATRFGWGPTGFRQAASFGVDDTVRTFVELEGGGAEAFRRMIAGDLYQAYSWRVRLFRPGETRETLVRFTPTGRAYGFREKLREDAPGASLPEDSARAIAERAAAADWGVDFSHYVRLPASQETRPGGRTDHTFIYERRGVAAGEGRYRLRLVVGGDRLTELTHFLRVPEAFARRYEKMRSTNNAIALTAFGFVGVLYLIGGCIIGLALLLRRRWVVWTPALTAGLIVVGVQAASQVCEWPLAWMGYDTALSPSTFLLRNVMVWIATFVLDGSLVVLSFAAAESLGRLAFPEHPQLWRMWSRQAAGTRQVVGRTASGLLLTGIEFGYIIGFYLLATRVWKWWSPSEALVDPNVLASWAPWLSAVAPSLHAGFWEEAMFRAVPIACGALIGQRYGRRGLGIGIALVLEALVFGGGHANYASVPAYSRPVELFVPAVIWGLVYLRFGLLPSIVTHYLFDLVLFALPLFTSTATSSRVDQALVILCGLVPVGVVLAGRLRARGATELPESLLNRAWVPAAEPEAETERPPAAAAGQGLAAVRARALLAAGAAGLLVWAFVGSFRADTPRLEIRRGQAIQRGVEALRSSGFEVAPRWKTMASVEGDGGLQGVFVWRALGRQMYRKLLGHDLMPPHWQVRVASFSGDVAERAEEWRAEVGADGAILRLRHELPQGRPGASLDEAAARALAQGEIRKSFGLDPARLKEVSAVSSKQPSRLDWVLTYADTVPPKLARGERRLSVEIAGDHVVSAQRFVFVPEDWQRAYRSNDATLGLLAGVRAIAIGLVLVAGAVLAILAWTRGGFPASFAVRFFAVLAVVGLVGGFNAWPTIEARFSTAQPLDLQVAIVAAGLVLGQLVVAAFIALLAGWARHELAAPAPGRAAPVVLHGLALGACAVGIMRLAGLPGVASGPMWGNYTAAQSFFPIVGEALSPVGSLLIRGSALFALLLLLHTVTRGWTERRVLGAILGVVVGGLAVHPANAYQPGWWLAQALAAGAALTAIYALFLRLDLRLVPWMLVGMGVLSALRTTVMRAHPDAVVGAALGGLLVVAVGWRWTAELIRPRHPNAADGAGAVGVGGTPAGSPGPAAE